MHELSLCKRILEIVAEHLIAHPDKKVKTIYLQLGELMLVDAAALQFSFGAITKDTALETASLVVEQILGEAWCVACNKSMHMQACFMACKFCGNNLIITCGNELRVRAMELE